MTQGNFYKAAARSAACCAAADLLKVSILRGSPKIQADPATNAAIEKSVVSFARMADTVLCHDTRARVMAESRTNNRKDGGKIDVKIGAENSMAVKPVYIAARYRSLI